MDPLASIVAQVTAAADAALTEAALSIGDVLPAIVLPPQNGQDYIEIQGQPVPAQLPSDVYPGETLTLQVTGFAGNQIVMRNLGTSETPPAASGASQSAPPAVSPPREVFVAASVRQAANPIRADLPQPRSIPAIDARIAAAQTAKIVQNAKIAPQPNLQTNPQTTPQARANATAPASLPIIVARTQAAVQNAATAVQRAVRSAAEFLRAANLPDTPLVRTAAAIAPHAPARLPSVLQRLDAALPRTSDDPRIATLRTLIGFVARIDPGNEETLATQISAYVSHVVEGSEPKLQQLLQAHAQAQPPASAPHDEREAAPRVQTIAQAKIVERSEAVQHNLKSVVLSLLREPPAQRSPAMAQALGETLVTLTGTQLNAISSNPPDANAIALTIPAFYREGGKPVQLRISRDGGGQSGKMDADNFHVAFVLDTANLGTVAIDLQTTGRAVKIDVKTEGQSAATRFSETLSALRGRLEDLRYRVASASASALATRKDGSAAPKARSQIRGAAARGVDLRA